MKVAKSHGSLRGFWIACAVILAGGLGAIVSNGPARRPHRHVEIPRGYAPVWMNNDTGAGLVAEFADYQCPTCRRVALATDSLLRRVVDGHGLQLRVYDFPLPQHRHAFRAAGAAYCSRHDRAFLEYRDSLFASQLQWENATDEDADAVFRRLARTTIGDTLAWLGCMKDSAYSAFVHAEIDSALAMGLRETPTYVFENTAISGNISVADMRSALDGLISSVRSGASK